MAMQHGGNGTGRRRFVALLSAVGLALAVGLSAASIFTVISPAPAVALENGVARTPPMGWNVWYTAFCDINEQMIVESADAMVSSGMKAAGYEYVNLDDCWMASSRDANGNLQADPEKFPHGIKWLADYVHSLGLKLGIYEDVGTETCAGYPGSYGHFQQDVDTFASWGVDFIKMDVCNVPTGNVPGQSQQDFIEDLYEQFGQALKNADRPMLYNICDPNTAATPWTWASKISNMWRTSGDYGNDWSYILRNLDGEAGTAPYAGPGHWNDPDILMVGLPGGMTDTEDQAHFSLWSILAAPLLAGNDLRSMTPTTKDILTNKEVIAVDQDPLGAQGDRVRRDGDADIWARPLANGDRAVVLLNRGSSSLTMSTSAEELGLAKAPAYTLRDLWNHQTTETAGRISAIVAPHSVVMYRVSAQGRVDPTIQPAISLTAPTVPSASDPDLIVLRPGEASTVTATLENDAPFGLSDVRLSLSAPAGWQVTPQQVNSSDLGSKQSLTVSWSVTPPNNADGDSSLSVTADYSYSHEATGSVSSQSTVLVHALSSPPAGTSYLSDLDWLKAESGCCGVKRDQNVYGGPLVIHGVTYPKGLWVNANAMIAYDLTGGCSKLTTDLGLDDSTAGPGSVVYQVYLDGQKAYDSGVVRNATPTISLDLDVTGAQLLRLVVTDAGDGVGYDNADFGGAQLTCAPKLTLHDVSPSPVSLALPGDSTYVSAQVTNPGPVPATNVSLTAAVPSGWTATPLATGGTSLAPGETGTWTWHVTAPAGAALGTYSGALALHYTSGGETGSASTSLPILLGVISHAGMTASADSSQEPNYDARYAIDDDPTTFWHTEFSPYQPPLPHEITLNLGADYDASGLLYLPRQDNDHNGVITSYTVSLSLDGTLFTPAANGSWADDFTTKSAQFPVQPAHYIRLTALAGHNGFASAAEINILGTPTVVS